MKNILLLEPPFADIAMEFEDAGEELGFFYMSMGDWILPETTGNSDIVKEMKALQDAGTAVPETFTFQRILEKYLGKVRKKSPAGYLIDTDVVKTLEEANLLLDVLVTKDQVLNLVIDIKFPSASSLKNVPGFMTLEEAEKDIEHYYSVLHPQLLSLFEARGVQVISFDASIENDDITYDAAFDILESMVIV